MKRLDAAVLALGCAVFAGSRGAEAQEPAAGGADAAKRDAAIDEKIGEATETHAADVDFWSQSKMTGDWGGLRTRLAEAGIVFEATLLVDLGKNFGGGVEPWGFEAFERLDVALNFDLDKLFGWTGGTFVVGGQMYRGGQMAELVGAVGGTDIYDYPPRTQLGLFYLDQTFADGVVKVRVGKFDLNYDCALPIACNPFVNSAAAYPATLLFMPTAPDPAFGAAVFVEDESWFLRAAVMDGALGQGIRTGSRGPKTLFGSPDDLYLLAEGGPKWSLDERRAGRATFGVWDHTGDLERFDGAFAAGTYGYYFIGEQRVWTENPDDKDDAQGLDLFVRYDHASEELSAVEHIVSVGASWTGPIAGRDDDILGAFVAWNNTSEEPTAGLDRDEWAIEAFYRLQLTPWFSVQPDVQFFVNPGGSSAADNTWLALLRITVDF